MGDPRRPDRRRAGQHRGGARAPVAGPRGRLRRRSPRGAGARPEAQPLPPVRGELYSLRPGVAPAVAGVRLLPVAAGVHPGALRRPRPAHREARRRPDLARLRAAQPAVGLPRREAAPVDGLPRAPGRAPGPRALRGAAADHDDRLRAGGDMTIEFAPLLTLDVTHAYYGGPCPDFEYIIPSRTERLLAGGRLLAKSRDGRLTVLFEKNDDGDPLVPLAGATLQI